MNEKVKIWIELAWNDLKSSQLLFDNKHYRTSYFFFQQASEKANKAFALFGGQLAEIEFKEIQHDQFLIFKKSIRKQETEIKTLLATISPLTKVANHNLISKTNLTEYCKSLSDSVHHIGNLKNSDLINISTQDLNYLLRQLKKAKDTKIKIPINYEKKFRNAMLNVADWVGQFETKEAIEAKKELQNFINDQDQTKKLYEVMLNQIFPSMIDIAFIHLTFYCCAIITYKHSTLTRYPENEINPQHLYKLTLPIVKKQKEFMSYLENAIGKLELLNNS